VTPNSGKRSPEFSIASCLSFETVENLGARTTNDIFEWASSDVRQQLRIIIWDRRDERQRDRPKIFVLFFKKKL